MGIDAQKRVVVLDDDELSESPDPRAAENDPARRTGIYRLPEFSGNTDSFEFRSVIEFADYFPVRGPCPIDRTPFSTWRLLFRGLARWRRLRS